jgi:hypothetical protein
MFMPIKKYKHLLTIIFLIASTHIFAQKKGLFSKKNILNQYATVGIGGGSSHYFGDLAPYRYFYYGIYTNVRWNGTLNYTRTLTSNVSGRISYTYARIYGDDNTYAARNLNMLSTNYLRNLHFRNDLQEFVISGIYNFLPQYGKGAKGRNKFMPYAALGFGFYGHNPKARNPVADNSGIWIGTTAAGTPELQQWSALRDFNTSGQGILGLSAKSYSKVQPVIPLALGIKIKINKNFDFSAEGSLRITPFDYLDDVGNTTYPSRSLMTSNFSEDAANLSYRAGEDYSATTGKNRVVNFLKILSNRGITTTGSKSPSLNGNDVGVYPIASMRRGSGKPDSYILTQFTISYVLSNSIKCPVIK